jgi:hypothetical protein
MFSGGTYSEVARWLDNFLSSHAKREDPRAEVMVEAGDEREGRSYGVRLRLGARVGPVREFEYREVADRRATLAWCRDLAGRVRSQVRELAQSTGVAAGPRE